MRLLIQRVLSAGVTVDQQTISKIGNGLLVFVGFENDDNITILEKVANKLLQLRIFSDESGKMNRSVQDVSGELLVVSQFTLYGSTQKGNRPSFTAAAHPELAQKLYQDWLEILQQKHHNRVQAGVFAASMQVSLLNNGPVTIWLDSNQWQ